MSYPKIETVYSLYARNKLPSFPPGLDYLSLYDYVAEDTGAHLCSTFQKRRKPGLNLSSDPFDSFTIKDYAKLFLNLTNSETIWLLSGRTEIRTPLGFVSQAAHTQLSVPLSTFLGSEKMRSIRVVWPKDGWLDYLGAYIEVIDATAPHRSESRKKEWRDKYGDYDVAINVSFIAGANPLRVPPHARISLLGNRNELFNEVMAKSAASAVLDMVTRDETRSEPSRLDALSAVSVGLLSMLLLDQKHRFVEKSKQLFQRSHHKLAYPFEPAVYSVGEGLEFLNFGDATDGRVYIEKFGDDDDGQIMFEWPKTQAE